MESFQYNEFSFCSEIAVLPKRDQHGNVVIAVRFSGLDANKYSHSAVLKTYFMVHDVFMLETGTVPGYVFMLDMKGCGIKHVTRTRISILKTYAEYIQVGIRQPRCLALAI
jgi:hypothetical protein